MVTMQSGWVEEGRGPPRGAPNRGSGGSDFSKSLPLETSLRAGLPRRRVLDRVLRHLRLDHRVDVVAFARIEFRQGVELAIGVLYRVLHSLLGARWRPLVCFAHGAPVRLETYRRVFAHRVAFSRDFNGIVCRPSDLDRPLPQSDPMLARYARRHLEQMLDRPNSGLGDKVRELV